MVPICYTCQFTYADCYHIFTLNIYVPKKIHLAFALAETAYQLRFITNYGRNLQHATFVRVLFLISLSFDPSNAVKEQSRV